MCVWSTVANAALVTQVAGGSEPNKAVDVNIDLDWRYISQSSTITREYFDAVKKTSYDATELKYSRSTHIMDAALRFGVYRGLELHFILPYALSDQENWSYATINGVSVAKGSTIANNNINASQPTDTNKGIPVTPLFAVPGRIYHAGLMDPKIGFAWAIFDPERAASLPATLYPPRVRTPGWVVGFDYTMPIANIWDPSKANAANADSNNPLAEGVGAHKFTWWIAMSKRLGIVEPFFKLHYTLPIAASRAYDNCNIALAGLNGKPQDPTASVMSAEGQAACKVDGKDTYWIGKTALEPQHVGGVLVGADLFALEQGKSGPNIQISLQFSADYVSQGRDYTELSDAMRKLTFSDQYFSLFSKIVVDFRFSKYLHWLTNFQVGGKTPHFLTAERVGDDRFGEHFSTDPSDKAGLPDGKVLLGAVNGFTEVNPNYDWRVDQPGRRFRAVDTVVVAFSTGLTANF